MADKNGTQGSTSSLPFDPDQVSVVRLNQSQVAELFGVTRQAVNQWIKTGKVTPFADGSLDPRKVLIELGRNADRARLKNQLFKQAADENKELRAELDQALNLISHLNQELDDPLTGRTMLHAREILLECMKYSATLDEFFFLLNDREELKGHDELIEDLFDQAVDAGSEVPQTKEQLSRMDMAKFSYLLSDK